QRFLNTRTEETRRIAFHEIARVQAVVVASRSEPDRQLTHAVDLDARFGGDKRVETASKEVTSLLGSQTCRKVGSLEGAAVEADPAEGLDQAMKIGRGCRDGVSHPVDGRSYRVIDGVDSDVLKQREPLGWILARRQHSLVDGRPAAPRRGHD